MRTYRVIIVSLISFLFLIQCANNSHDQIPPRVLFNDPVALLETQKRAIAGDVKLTPALDKLRVEAEAAMLIDKIYSVMDKPFIPPSGDKHDYMSVGPYWWPDTTKADGLPYIRRDGQVNPERTLYDRVPLWRLDADVTVLAIAYFFFNEEKYAKRASKLVRAWFLDKETKMNPHLNYGQAIPGITDGRGIGIIDTRSFFKIVEAIELLADSKSWRNEDEIGLKNWFNLYVKWLMESENGIDEEDGLNNHGTWYDVILASLAMYTDQDEIAKKVITAFAEHRIKPQIKPDGSQPLELSRTRSYHYSTMNLKGMFYIAMLGEKLGVRVLSNETEHGQLVKQALDYLIPHMSDKEDWPYEQIKGWEADDSEALAMIIQLSAKYFDEPEYLTLLDSIPEIEFSDHRLNLLFPI